MALSPARVETVEEFDKAPDLKSQLRIVDVAGVKVIELRDYIPSSDEHGRGYWFPAAQRGALIKALQAMGS